MVKAEVGEELARNKFLRKLVDIQYTRNDTSLLRGSFRVRGDIVDILPSHQKDEAIRIEFFGDEIDGISIIDALTGNEIKKLNSLTIYPNSHYVTDRKDMRLIVKEILEDLGVRLTEYKALGKFVEYQRLEQRTMHDVELLEQLGFCPGIENYSRYLTGKKKGDPPPCLLDYFPDDFLMVIDESHITVPQVRGMYRGDQARKGNLVEYGFRLPSALDNRPLNFDEFDGKTNKVLYVSATPGPYELEHKEAEIVEQLIRPTGLIDPEITVRPVKGQVDDLLSEIHKTVKKGFRILITTLTKKMSEDLTVYYEDMGIKVKYLHSDIDSLERTEILRGLRAGEFDVLIGINLLREGLDLPEVALVGVMDADKEGFLRSRSSLIQITGRAARNSEGRVIFYGDKITDSMKAAMDETKRRRAKQMAYNKENNIEPATIIKALPKSLRAMYGLEDPEVSFGAVNLKDDQFSKLAKKYKTLPAIEKDIKKLSKAMKKAAAELEFEDAADLRNELRLLQEFMMTFLGPDNG
jgi:excinuclease ABC subunit B